MSGTDQRTIWQRWFRQPQKIWLRRALFQAHLWTGLAFGVYVLIISVTGSLAVYRDELYKAATPAPILSKGSAPRLSDSQLSEIARQRYPGYRVQNIMRAENPDRAVDVWLRSGDQVKKRLFDARTGGDLGDSVPAGIWLVSKLLDLHDNLLAGPTGRKVNGIGALAFVALAITGLVIWWPGAKIWRRSLTLHHGVGWKRWNWHFHSMLGFWTLGFTLMFGATGFYLGLPQPFQDLVDRLEPMTAANAGERIGDQVLSSLAYLHVGRINRIDINPGIRYKRNGLWDQMVRAVWALFGLTPAVMFVTGAIMWWNRALCPRLPLARAPARSPW